MTALKGQFDRYSLTARVLPGLIAFLPVLLIAGILMPHELTNYVVGLAMAAGLLFLMATVVRTLGRRIENRLVAAWNGKPTTHLLRYGETKDRATLDRRRNALAGLIGRDLPSARAEAGNPTKADQEYVAATRQLILLVQQHAASFPRVQDENISYGFIRNLLGIKPFGISTVVFAGMFVGFGHTLFATGEAILIDAISLLLLIAWIFYVTPTRVREAGDLYAARLMECLDTPDIFGRPASDDRPVQST